MTETLLPALLVVLMLGLFVACVLCIRTVFTQKSDIANLRAMLSASARNEQQQYAQNDKLTKQLEDAYQNMHVLVDKEVMKSVGAQRSTIKGQLAEQMYPILGDCPYSPSDMRFMGDFCDYIVIDGYTDVKDGSGEEIKQIVFVEIKTGKSRLSKHQAKIRDAVLEGRVSWNTVRL